MQKLDNLLAKEIVTYQSPDLNAFTKGPSTNPKANLPLPCTC